MSQSNEDSQPNNLLMFNAAMSKSLQDIAKCVSEEEFLKIFTMLESKKSVIKKLHKVMEEDLYGSMNQDILQTLITEECVVEGMKKVAKLSEETTVPSNVKLWRPPGDVNLHMRSIDAVKMIKECEKLQEYINSTEKENNELMKKVTKRREHVQSVSDHMKQLLNMPFKLSELENIVKFNQEQVEKLHKNVS